MRVFYRKKATAIRRVKKGSRRLELSFGNGSVVKTRKIITDIGKRNMIALGLAY